MIFKKIAVLACTVLGLAFSSNLLAQEAPPSAPLITISPASGQYLESQKFDIAINFSPEVILPYPFSAPFYNPIPPYGYPPYPPYAYPSFYKFSALVNGVDVSGWFNDCIQEHRKAITDNQVLLCKSLDYSPFVAGENKLTIFFSTPYQNLAAEASYTLIKSSRVTRQLPFKFNIQGTSFNTASGLKLALNERVVIDAVGRVNTWPANTTFPLSTPAGTQTCSPTGTCLLPGAPVGALLVKIGPYGRWLVAGSRLILIADRPGELIFAVNDKTELLETSDNIGFYEVNISR